MQGAFIFFSLTGLLYFLFTKRTFDLYSLAFIAACVYFSPGFIGQTIEPSRLMNIPTEIVDETYLIMIVVVVSILLASIVFDRTVRLKYLRSKLVAVEQSWFFALGLALIGGAMTLATTGRALLYPDKVAMMSELNRWQILWAVGASIGAVFSYSNRKFTGLSICLILLLADLYIGFRVSLAITVIALCMLYLVEKGPQRFVIDHWRVGLFGLFSALFFFVYKFLYISIKAGAWGQIVDRLIDPLFYLTALLESEPFTTQSILNEVVSNQFRVGIEHFIGLGYNLMLFSSNMGGEVVSFNDLFQPELFPFVESGMANNIWAEMWSSGGWILLLMFIGFFNFVLAIGSYLLRLQDPILRAWVALLGNYWAFYIHRNDIIYQITLEKRVFLIGLICMFMSVIFTNAIRKKIIR